MDGGGPTRFARSLRVQALVAGVALALLVTGLFLAQSRATDGVVDAERDARRSENVIARANALERRVVDLETGLRGYALTGVPTFLQPFENAVITVPRQLEELRAIVAADPRLAARIDALGADIRSYITEYAPRVRQDGAAAAPAVVREVTAEGKRRVDAIRARLASFVVAERRLSADRTSEAESKADRVRILGWVGIGAGLLGIALTIAYFLRRVITPVERMRGFARSVASGSRDVRLAPGGHGEVADLSDALGNMAATLADQEAAARGHAANLAAVADVAQKLPTAEARQAIAEAACRLSGAAVAVLLEPDGKGNLVSTARAGAPMGPVTIPIDPTRSTAARVFALGEAVFAPDAGGHPGAIQSYVEETGSRSVLWQPIRAGDGTSAVLIVGWGRELQSMDAEGTEVIRLLAAEAAVAVERSDMLASLRHAADHDALTGLVNRRRFYDELRREVARSERHGREVAVLIVDLDGFKAVNDKDGHAAGDALLCRVADTVTERVRSTDVVSRLGGDEFAVLLPETGPAEAHRLAGTVSDAIRERAGVGASVGAAASVHGTRFSPEDLTARADAAMYEAKGRR